MTNEEMKDMLGKALFAILERRNGKILRVKKAEPRKYFVGFERGFEKDNMVVVVYQTEAEDVIKSVFMPHPMSKDDVKVEDITDEIRAELG